MKDFNDLFDRGINDIVKSFSKLLKREIVYYISQSEGIRLYDHLSNHEPGTTKQVTKDVLSCIALCIWDRTLKIGSMAHIMLPEPTNRKAKLKTNYPAKYANLAVKKYLKKLKIKIVHEDIGGNRGRNVLFCTQTGEVTTRQVQKTMV